MKPIFTLRGHNSGVTSLAYCQLPDDRQPHLISGDEEGTLVVWDLTTFKRVAKFENIFRSTIQSVKGVNLSLSDKQTIVLVVQSRNDGVQVLEFYEPASDMIKSEPNILASFPTYDSLFSRGDAKSTKDGRAILAHPSLLENYLVTIRILGRDAKTEMSGTAGKDNKAPVFDIEIRSLDTEGNYHLFAGYEDGFVNIFAFQLNATRTVPVLNSEGLDIKPMKRIDLNFKDFVSAYDVMRPTANDENYLLVAGSPGKELCFITCSLKLDREPDIHRLRLKTSGVSALSIGPDAQLVAVACWDKSVRLYSTDRVHALMATLDQHTKQVQTILFTANKLLCCASQDGTISISS